MILSRRIVVAAIALCFLGLSSCGSDEAISLQTRHLQQDRTGCFNDQGTDWFGGDIFTEPIVGVGLGGCCTECLEEPSCVGFVWRQGIDHCWPKNVINPPSPCNDCFGENFNEEDLDSSCTASSAFDQFGNDLPGMPLTITQPTACCQACNNNPDCVAWTWRRDFHQCWLKFATNEQSSCPACITGTK